jgi:uncharacterized protein (TIGR03083 family)
MAADEPDNGTAYRDLRKRVAELVLLTTDEQLDATPPATPGWRTRDVLAHMTGTTADILNGRLDGVGSDPWTQVQVDERRDWALADLLAEWETTGPQIEPLIPSFGIMAGQFIVDSATHEQDVRGALDAPGARDTDAMDIAFEWLGLRVGELRTGAGAGGITVTAEDGPHTFGDAPAEASCTTTKFEFMRAATARRSHEQIGAWGWDGDARTELVVMPIFTARPDPLVE